MGTYFVYLDISNTAGTCNPVGGIGTLDREIRCRSVQIMHEYSFEAVDPMKILPAGIHET